MHIINEIGESQLLWNLREYVCSMVDPKKKASLPRGPFDVSKGALAQLFSLSLSLSLLFCVAPLQAVS